MYTPKSAGWAYLLWLFCLVGFCGIHRFYAGKWISGLIWFFTFGLLGIGQLIDLLLINGMINSSNLRSYVRSQACDRHQMAYA